MSEAHICGGQAGQGFETGRVGLELKLQWFGQAGLCVGLKLWASSLSLSGMSQCDSFLTRLQGVAGSFLTRLCSEMHREMDFCRFLHDADMQHFIIVCVFFWAPMFCAGVVLGEARLIWHGARPACSTGGSAVQGSQGPIIC